MISTIQNCDEGYHWNLFVLNNEFNWIERVYGTPDHLSSELLHHLPELYISKISMGS